ncbi:MAG: hypothetical protein M3033_15715 [Acidobacteriota bacterium]|nr:hypothetical protein [Acidobacteriota bacterium]
MSKQDEHQEIWKQIKGSEQLFKIYKYFPTLHDARIKNIDINFEIKEFTLTVDYWDYIEKPGDGVLTRITIVWSNILKATFNWYAEQLIGMKFEKTGDFIKATFEEYSSGFYGEIISSSIEIRKVEIEPKESDEAYESVKFTIN